MTRLGSKTLASNWSNEPRPLRRQVRSHRLALAVDRVALGTELPEDRPPGARVAGVLPQVLAHRGDDLLPPRVPLLADRAPRLLDRPDRLAVVALQDLAEVVGVQGAPGQLLRQHGVEQLPGPRLPLQAAGRPPGAGAPGRAPDTAPARPRRPSDRPTAPAPPGRGRGSPSSRRRGPGRWPRAARGPGTRSGRRALAGGPPRAGPPRRTVPDGAGVDRSRCPSREARSWASNVSGRRQGHRPGCGEAPAGARSRNSLRRASGISPSRSETAARHCRASSASWLDQSLDDRPDRPQARARTRRGCDRRPGAGAWPAPGHPSRSTRSISRTNRPPWSGRSGWRFCQTIGGMSRSSPQADSTSTRTGSGSSPSIFRAAMATWSCTSGDWSRARAPTRSRIAGSTWPEVPGGPDAPGPVARVGVVQQPGVELGLEAAGADQGPQAVHPRLAGRRVVEDQRLAAGRRIAGVFRSARSRWAVSRK